MDDPVYETLARIPRFADAPRDALGVERLGGLTNRVYRVSHDGQSLCLRVPGQGTEAYIDREPVDDFWAYSINRFERCKALMGREAFVGHLNAVRQGD